MRLTRVYVDAPLGVGLLVDLPEHVNGHLVRVLRLREGDPCVLFNGDGHDYEGRISHVGKRGVQAEVLSTRRIDNESPLSISLMQGIARGEKMDLILQKATELGVNRFIPVHSERSEVKLEGARAIKRLAHWRGVVASACEQSGRALLPQVDEPTPMQQALSGENLPTARYYLSPLAEVGINELPAPSDGQLLIAVGPEGGWSERDLQSLNSSGFIGLRLGPRNLRTETAGLAAVSALQMRLGDLG